MTTRIDPSASSLAAAAQAAVVIARLRSLRSERNIEGMRRFGIASRHEQLGVSVATLREIGRPPPDGSGDWTAVRRGGLPPTRSGS